MDIPLVPQRFKKGFTEAQVVEADPGIDRDRGLADLAGAESFTLGGDAKTLARHLPGLEQDELS